MWNNLKASIASVVKTNNNQEITGANLQSVLNAIVNSVGANATFVDVATFNTSPGTPDGPVFYIAAEKGIYPNFGNTEIEDGKIAIFLWNGSTWLYKKITISPDLDNKPTVGSNKGVKSGGVHAYTTEYFDKFSFDSITSGSFIILKKWDHIFPAGAHYSIRLIGASFESADSNSKINLALWNGQSTIEVINTGSFNNICVDGEFANEVENLHLALNTSGDFSNVSGYVYVKIDGDIKHNTFFHKCLNQTINYGFKEIYLSGLNENQEYYFFVTRYNGNYYIQLTNQETLNANTIVAETRIVSGENAVRTLTSVNDTGISGYVLFDYTVLDNEPESNHSLGPCRIRKDNASNLLFCPSIESYLENYNPNVDELYLTGVDENIQYYKRLTEWNGRWMYQIFNSSTVSTKALVAQTFVDGIGIQSIIPYNGSTVSGYAYISELVSSETPELIDNDYVTNLDNSPKIKDFLLGNTTIIINKNGSGDYTSLLEGILEATQHMNAKVYVEGFENVSGEEDGVYNLVKEYKEKYGNSYWDDYNNGGDIQLKNRVHIIFAANTVVKFEYQGEGGNPHVHHEFSPFRSGPRGFILENATIVASNCRYCVHDERNSETDQYTNKYINCTMKLDNSENNIWVWQGDSGDYPDYGYIQCIGGGLGKCGYIEVTGCYFESVIPDTINIRDDERGVVSWHNSLVANAKSHLIIANNYFVGKTTFRLSWYGASTKKTTALVYGNLFGIDIINCAETPSSSNNNTEIKKWDNDISGIIDENNNPQFGYYECSTNASTAEKEVEAYGYALPTTGGSIKIKMINANTAINATLNINNTGAKPLYYAGERASANNSWEAGETIEVYYDGTNFMANSVAGGSGSGDGVLNAPKSYISEASMDNFLSRLGSVMGGTWSKTWNAESEQYDFSFTQSVQST